MRNRRRTETGFIGEDAAGETLLHRHHDGITKEAPADTLEGEGTGKNPAKHCRDLADAHDDQDDTGQNVEHRHEGNKKLGDFADALDAAQSDQCNHKRDQEAGQHRREVEQVSQRAGDLTALGNVADTEGGKAAQQTEDNCQPLPFFPDSVFNIVHRAAVVDAVLILDAVLHGKDDFGVLGHHAEEGSNPHPEHRASAAGEDGARHARDIAGADRAGKGSRNSLEG